MSPLSWSIMRATPASRLRQGPLRSESAVVSSAHPGGSTLAVVTSEPHVAVSPARPVGKYDRLFYGGIALATAVMTFVGFGPTYYLRFLDGGPRATISGGSFSGILHLHGVLFTAWVLLFLTQTALISGRRAAVHRKLEIGR